MDERRKKLRFRAWRRGFREIDLILGRFADAHIAALDAAGLDAFEALLDAPDQRVYEWIAGLSAPPADFDTPTLKRLRAFAESSAPSPLAGEGVAAQRRRVGGRASAGANGADALHLERPPPPYPSPQGGGGIDPPPEKYPR